MKVKLMYLFLILVVANLLINGVMNFINLMLAGIVLAILADKSKSGDFSTWKLVLGLGISGCSVFLGIMNIFGFIHL